MESKLDENPSLESISGASKEDGGKPDFSNSLTHSGVRKTESDSTIIEPVHNFDVTFMVSMPLLVQANSEPIPMLAIYEEEEALRTTLAGKTKILHFCGHGYPHSLVFEVIN